MLSECHGFNIDIAFKIYIFVFCFFFSFSFSVFHSQVYHNIISIPGDCKFPVQCVNVNIENILKSFNLGRVFLV